MTLALTFALALLASSPTPDTPSSERVVFHTVAGDSVFVLYPDAAPQTVAQFLKLVRAGVYDTTAFTRIYPGFVAQVSTAQDRQRPLTADQAALIHKLPLETSALIHSRGTLSIARPDSDPNGGETSFCILLGPAPQLDGKYTIFGRLEKGDDVLARLLEVPRTDRLSPTVRLTIDRADVFDSPQALSKVPLNPAHAVPGAQVSSPGAEQPRDEAVAAGLALIILCVGAASLLRGRISPKLSGSLNLIALLIATFSMLVLLITDGQRHAWLASALFFGTVATFRALGKFEMAAPSNG